MLKEIIFVLDKDKIITRKYVGVPNLSRYSLWVDWQSNLKRSQAIDKILYNLDNKKSIFDIAELTKIDFREVLGFIEDLKKKNLVDF